MATFPTDYLRELGPEAQAMAKNCKNERLAMTLQYVAIDSMIIMAGVAAAQLLRVTFGSPGHERGRSK
jgi:hypothetical protein